MTNRTPLKGLVAILVAAVAAAAAGCGSDGGSGGSASSGADRAKSCTYGILPKAVGNEYWAAVGKGAKEAGTKLGIKVDFNGPTTADASGQTQFIDSWIQKKYCAISISATDPNALVPALQRAKKAGASVSTFDADTDPAGRDVFLNQVTFPGMGKAMADTMVKYAGDSGNFLVITSTLTAPNQSRWIDEMKKYIAATYPNMKIAAILPGQEDDAKSRDVALGYLRSHPNTKGVISMTQAVPGIAEASKQLNLAGKLPIIGIGPPSCCTAVLKDGSANAMVLWDPVAIGYAAVYMAHAQVAGMLKEGEGNVLAAGRLGDLKFISKDTILLGEPTVFTKDNMDQYDF